MSDSETGHRIQKLSLRLQNARYLNFKTAGTCSHSSGRKWPQVAASGRRGLLEQVAASGRSGLLGIGLQTSVPIALLHKPWKKVFPRKYFFNLPCSGILGAARASGLAATCSHLQPLEWPQVAAWNERKEVMNKGPDVKQKEDSNA